MSQSFLRKTIVYISLGLLLLTAFCSIGSADQKGVLFIEEQAKDAFRQIDMMIKQGPLRLRTVVMPFTGYSDPLKATRNDYAGPDNSDERYFAVSLFDQLVVSNKFQVFTRDKLDKALQELKLQMKDLFDPMTAKRLGKFIGADLLILMEGYIGNNYGMGSGAYDTFTIQPIGGTFRVKIIVIDVETAEVKAIWKKYIQRFR